MGKVKTATFKEFSVPEKHSECPSTFSELITQPAKCWSNEFHLRSSKNAVRSDIEATDALFVDNFLEETVLALAVWAVAIICFLAFFLGVLLVLGMMILVLMSFQHLMSLKKSLKSQVRLLFTIKKQLRRKPHLWMRNIVDQGTSHVQRQHQNVRPTSHPSHRLHRRNIASNSPFHPRNNTPVSSCDDSFSSHASLSLSDLPSVSSFTPSVSDDVPSSEFTSSSRVTAIHPVSGRNFQRCNEELCERELPVTEPRATMLESIGTRGRGGVVLQRNERRVSLQNCPPLTSYETIGHSNLRIPKEYWL
ncbi:uncharacterized protein LOC124171061 isoform X2 [Ischnura elegans]|uniref:uncharacterized protein LOC124171061 isoform X2 n=1 Tax=Ischnura elegans TaxID=197161 RepID=UPI001ED88213|nr:uncharacterized protein LOC124171061 isoform X2 [Ischnura elegans]